MESNDIRHEMPGHIPLALKIEAGILGAAVGDALGWPDEGRATRSGRQNRTDSQRAHFISWARKAGGRFYAHEDQVGPGEYSDDTQLIIASAKCLIQYEDWYAALTQTELPFWTAYERGGGGATKRAADAWLSGKPPWMLVGPDRERYFAAGGNGVVMRILPHVDWEAQTSDFSIVADEIVRNGIATHGHPRALVGSLAYAFAAWHQLRSSETLGYGALLDILLDSRTTWSRLPESLASVPSWLESANAVTSSHYEDLWANTVEEQLSLLRTAKSGISKGALAVDQETLSELGCFDKRVSGSGTIAAAAAVFLASRYAADPMNGLCEAAYSRGADTDTLASLVGGLLGLVNGLEWLGALADEVQDSSYLRSLARSLAEKKPVHGRKPRQISGSEVERFLRELPRLIDGQSVVLPDGQSALAQKPLKHSVGSGKMQRIVVPCITTAGQTLHLKKFIKSADRVVEESDARVFDPITVERVVLRLPVRDIERSKQFYVNALGMKITRDTPGSVTLGGVLALTRWEAVNADRRPAAGSLESSPIQVFIETKHLDAAYRNVKLANAKVLSDIVLKDNRRHFLCADPDGISVDVLEQRPG
jgi:ADP-ribosylglycohydrolase/catechol 2,3-dioxygenase-like lactoylglutathione lyase family enzyme